MVAGSSLFEFAHRNGLAAVLLHFPRGGSDLDMALDAPTVTLAELAAGVAETPLLRAGAAVHEPVLIVDLDDADEATVAAAAAKAAVSQRLLVGRSGAGRALPASITAALDLTYVANEDGLDRTVVGADDVDAALARFVAGVTQCPQAALTTGRVLRISEALPVPEAIDVESLAYSTLQGGLEFGRWLQERRALGRPLPPPPVAEPVLVDRDGDALHITLNRPERRNAYGTALRDALVAALELPLVDESITTVEISGAGSSFCAGGDLDEFGHTPDTATAHLVRTRGGAGWLVARLADRVRVRLHGGCVGAGIEIPAFAGHVVASADSAFRLPEVSMGLLPGAGGTVSVPRRIGRWRALHVFVTGVSLDAGRALSWGLIDEVRDSQG